MPRTKSISSSRSAEPALMRIPVARIHPHPANPNVMDEPLLRKLAENIRRVGRYIPLVVRPHPELPGHVQLIDGDQRRTVLIRLGHRDALCLLWDCDDVTALMLLASLNRLRGDDLPARRAELLADLSARMPTDVLATLIPEDESEIQQLIALVDLDVASLMADLEASAARTRSTGPQLVSFAVPPEDLPAIDSAIDTVMGNLEGANRRGRALGVICRRFREANDA